MSENTNLYRELLIGCGHSREKRIRCPVRDSDVQPGRNFVNLTTLDNTFECKPDVFCDLTNYSELTFGESKNRIPVRSMVNAFPKDDYFDEIHAYEVIEHCGRQGDYRMFFRQFNTFWHWLKPNGYFCATVPAHTSPWAWGDPGHTRIINRGTLVFLDQDEYARQLGKTSMSDYREALESTNFKCEFAETVQETFRFVLRAVK